MRPDNIIIIPPSTLAYL